MTLKELLVHDLDAVFFRDVDGVAEKHNINGKSGVICIVNSDKQLLAAGKPRMSEGVRGDSLFLFIKCTEFARTPEPGEAIRVDGVKFSLRHVDTEEGVYIIEYGRTKDARRVSGN